MKVSLAFVVVVLAFAACGVADAATTDDGFDIVSVVPRSPNVKPVVMAISTREWHKRVAPQQMSALVAGH